MKFSWGPWIGGFIAAGFLLCFGNVFGLVLAADHIGNAGGVIGGAVPGLILAAAGFAYRRHPFGLGILTGACLMALLGGICGAFLTVGG